MLAVNLSANQRYIQVCASNTYHIGIIQNEAYDAADEWRLSLLFNICYATGCF